MFVAILLWHPRGNHVCVIHFVNLETNVIYFFIKSKEKTNIENLENVIFVCDAVKHGVECVEKIGHLKQC